MTGAELREKASAWMPGRQLVVGAAIGLVVVLVIQRS